MSKWTKWIPHTGDECPVAYRERIKVKTLSGRVEKDMAGEFDWVDGGITHFKRRKKNVAAEEGNQPNTAETSASKPENPEMGITPKLIITGPGEYVTRDGRKATVEGSRIDVCGGVRFMGDVSGNVIGWDEDGLFCAPGHHPCDIIGPWTEDTADLADTKAEEPEMWVNVFEYRDGSRECTDPVPTKSEALICNVRGTAPIGTYKLVKEE